MSSTTKEWAKTREAEVLLGISERSLLRLRKNKVLTPGHCWRRTIPNNVNSNVIYNIPACLEVLNGIAAANEVEQDLLEKEKQSEVSY